MFRQVYRVWNLQQVWTNQLAYEILFKFSAVNDHSKCKKSIFSFDFNTTTFLQIGFINMKKKLKN